MESARGECGEKISTLLFYSSSSFTSLVRQQTSLQHLGMVWRAMREVRYETTFNKRSKQHTKSDTFYERREYFLLHFSMTNNFALYVKNTHRFSLFYSTSFFSSRAVLRFFKRRFLYHSFVCRFNASECATRKGNVINENQSSPALKIAVMCRRRNPKNRSTVHKNFILYLFH